MLKQLRRVKENSKQRYEAAIKEHYRKQADERIELLMQDHTKEINRMREHCDHVISNKNFFYEKEMKTIREQEIKKYNTVLEERQAKILELQNHIHRHKESLIEITKRETEIEDIARGIEHKFERGVNAFVAGLQIIKHANEDIEKFKNKSVKNEIKYQKALDE